MNYAQNKGLRTLIYTNGLALNKDLLIELRNNGASQILIHIDSYQGRNGYREEKDLLKLRDYYCNMFRGVRGVKLGFIQPVSADKIEDINLTVNFYRKNIDIISLVVYTLYRDIYWEADVRKSINTNITIEDVVSKIKHYYQYTPCAFLESANKPENITWLFSLLVGFKDKEIGFLDGDFYKFIQERYRKIKGKFLFINKENKMNILKLFYYFNFKCVRDIVKNYFKTIAKNPIKINQPIYFQTMLILRGPEKTESSWDLCRACPDAMFYDGKLVPSCILEGLRRK